MKKILLLTAAILLSACSEKALYDNVPLSEYDDCMSRASKPYEEYERERQEATGS